MNKYRDSDILDRLDEIASSRESGFPAFGHIYMYYICSRVVVFLDADSWCIFVEHVSVFNRLLGHKAIMNNVYAYTEMPILDANVGHLNTLHPTTDHDDPLFDVSEAEYPSRINPRARHVMLGDYIADIPSDITAYAKYGIELLDAPRIHSQELMRYLSELHKDKLFSPINHLGWHISNDIELFGTYTACLFPDIENDELPSDSVYFQWLARMMENGDTRSKYQGPVNSHWSDWPLSGTF